MNKLTLIILLTLAAVAIKIYTEEPKRTCVNLYKVHQVVPNQLFTKQQIETCKKYDINLSKPIN